MAEDGGRVGPVAPLNDVDSRAGPVARAIGPELVLMVGVTDTLRLLLL